MMEVQGYALYRLDRDTKPDSSKQKRGGGLITYVRNTSTDVYVQELNTTSSKDIEIQWLKITRANSKTLLLANVYKPPMGKVEQAVKLLEQGLLSLSSPNYEVVILGDFNVDYKNKKSQNFKKIKCAGTINLYHY